MGAQEGGIWGLAEGGDKLSGILINLWGQTKEPSKIARAVEEEPSMPTQWRRAADKKGVPLAP